MTDESGHINDFITVNTKFDRTHDAGWETSEYTGVQDFFESHLQGCLNTDDGLAEYDIDVYKVRVGDIIKVNRSIWSKQFSEKHNLPADADDDYAYEYRVKDVQITVFSRNPKADSPLPKLVVDITLERVK